MSTAFVVPAAEVPTVVSAAAPAATSAATSAAAPVMSRATATSVAAGAAASAAAASRQTLTRSDIAFPERCLAVEPVVESLQVLGDSAILNCPALAIVGARKATPYGLSCAEHFGSLAAEMGLIVVSGGAIGCDQAAHRGALRAQGKTVAVLGCGADVVYPARAARLFAQILSSGGALLSEAPWGSPPLRFAFRRRNRIIAGLGLATLIVEAGLPSGTFSTADAALALGREVMVVPGSIHSRESTGSNRLLLQGALPVVDDESFLSYLSEAVGEALPVSQTPDGSLPGGLNDIESALMAKAMTVEEVATLRGGDITATVRELSALEFAGSITRLRDGRYTVCEQRRYH